MILQKKTFSPLRPWQKINKSITFLIIAVLFSSCCSFSQTPDSKSAKIFPQPEIPFSPKHYICYRTETPVNIDGKLNESAWKHAAWTDYFVDIEGNLKPLPRYKTRVKMLWDDNYLYIAAHLQEPDLWATLKQHDAVIYRDNDFEVFIDPDGDTFNYYELELNALKTYWDLLLLRPYRDGGKVAVNGWEINGLKVGVNLEGTLNNPSDRDSGWTVELALPWSVLMQCAPGGKTPKAGDQWRINFSRVEWRLKADNGRYVKQINPLTGKTYPEDNWVWSPQGIIAMHYPEMWGYLQFSGQPAGGKKDKFVMKKDEYAKWALRKVYYNERTFFMNNGAYTGDLTSLNLREYKVDGFDWPPEIRLTQHTYEADLKSTDGTKVVIIKSNGRVTEEEINANRK